MTKIQSHWGYVSFLVEEFLFKCFAKIFNHILQWLIAQIAKTDLHFPSTLPLPMNVQSFMNKIMNAGLLSEVSYVGRSLHTFKSSQKHQKHIHLTCKIPNINLETDCLTDLLLQIKKQLIHLCIYKIVIIMCTAELQRQLGDCVLCVLFRWHMRSHTLLAKAVIKVSR